MKWGIQDNYQNVDSLETEASTDRQIKNTKISNIRGRIMLALHECREIDIRSRELSLAIINLKEADMWLTKVAQQNT